MAERICPNCGEISNHWCMCSKPKVRNLPTVKVALMARNFRLEDYETVEDRLERALGVYKDLRVVTVNHTTPQDREARTWVVEARVYMNAGDQAADLPKATGWTIDGSGLGEAEDGNCEA